MESGSDSALRDIMERWRKAVAARDLDKVMSFYAPGEEFIGYDFVPPFVFTGFAEFRREWESTFLLFDEDPAFELRDLKVHSSGDLAIVFGLSHFSGKTHGQPVDIWTRQTNAFRRSGDQWLMMHEHVSVPIDMESMKGVVDYRP